MVIFHSYVKLPEGRHPKTIILSFSREEFLTWRIFEIEQLHGKLAISHKSS